MPGLAGEVANLVVALKLDDSGFTGKLNTAARNLQGLDRGLSQMGRGVGQVGAGFVRLGERAALAAAGGLTAVVTTAASFESAFAGVAKTVDATDAELDDLEQQFRALAREIPLSFEELAAIGETGGALGIAKADLIDFTEIVAQLGATTDLSTDQAAVALGQLQNVLGLTADEFDNFGAALVDLGNKGASTESQIIDIASRAGAAGDLIGLSADEVLGFGAAVANLGIEAEAGGSALQRFFLDTLKNIQDDDTLQIMADTAGVTADAFVQAFEKDASGALETFIIGLGDLQEAEQLAVLEALGFTDIRITRALLGLAGDTDNLSESLDIAAEGWQENTALAEEFRKRQETTAALWQVFKNNARDALATIGTELLPVANDLMREFVGFINQPETQANLKAFATDLADGVRSLVTELKGTDFSGIIGGIKLAAEVAKGAFDAFRSLPQPIQQLAIAALVANKVTGGAIGQIAGGLANIFGGALKTIFAQHVTVVGGSVTGGGPGAPTGGPGAGPLGLLGTAGIAAAVLAGITLVATEVSRSVNPTGFNFNQLAGQSGATRVQVEGDLVRLSEEMGLSIEELQRRAIPLLESGDRKWGDVVDELRTGFSDSERQQERATAAARDAIPWHQRNLAELQNFNMSEGTRFGRLGALTEQQKQAIHTLNASEGTRAANLQALARTANSHGSRTAAATEATSRKNFSPTLNNNIKIPVTVRVSATVIQQQLIDLRQSVGGGGFI